MEKGFVLVDPKHHIVIRSFHVTRKEVERDTLAWFSSIDNWEPKWTDMYKIGWRIRPAILHLTM